MAHVFEPALARALARDIRLAALQMVHAARASHIGGALSMADVLGVLYGGWLRVDPARPDDPARDRFILSKGHACTALYAALALRGFFPRAWLDGYARDGSLLMSHVSHHVPGVEFSTGSLGHGLPFAVGKALAANVRREGWRTVALLSDGELDEGSNWEALLFAGHHRLSGLTAVVDCNGIQSLGRVEETLSLEPLAAKLEAFGWEALEVDGHDVEALHQALSASRTGRPRAIVARTVKGKGVSFMEDRLEWHYKSPDAAQLAAARAELGGDDAHRLS
ncbi:MAG: transketolase [Candidatus Sericytochromatia bacterium]|nr:transketolase [Candidatus Sericytochromatia bacterium]